jgi:hypothetical protein
MLIAVVCRLSKEAMFFVGDHHEFAQGLSSKVAAALSDVLRDSSRSDSRGVDPYQIAKDTISIVQHLFEPGNFTLTGWFEDSETFVVDVHTEKYIHAQSTTVH